MSMKKLPNDLVLAITYNCNSRCRMCNIWKMEAQPVLDLAEYEKLPAKIKEVNISGGEPFLSPNLVPLIKLLVEKNPKIRIIISTNGFATDLIAAKIKEIIKIKPDIGLGLSVDGLGEIHDQIRGIPGGFNKVMATLKMLKESGVKNLRLAFTAADYNISELHKIYKLAKDLNVEFTLAAVHNADNYFNTVENKITKLPEFKKEFELLISQELNSWDWKRLARAYFAYALYKFVATGKRLLPNYSGLDNVFIDPVGNVYPADVSAHLMGNLRDFDSLGSLYASPKAQAAIGLEKLNQNWMICTARSAMKKHPFKILFWLIKSKIAGIKL